MSELQDNLLVDGSEIKTNVIFRPGSKLSEIERDVILQTLKEQNYNRTHAARVLGIGIRTLQRKLKQYGASTLGLKRHYVNA